MRDTPTLPDVLWVGGGSGAGTPTVAVRLAERHGLRRYDTDAAMADHVRRCWPQECPLLAAFLETGADERWVDRSPPEMLATPRFRRAAFVRRGTTAGTTGTTSDPQRALADLLERDALFTEVLRAEVARFGLAAAEVDVGTGVDAVMERVGTAIGL